MSVEWGGGSSIPKRKVRISYSLRAKADAPARIADPGPGFKMEVHDAADQTYP